MASWCKIIPCKYGDLLVYWEPQGDQSKLHRVINTEAFQIDLAVTYGQADAAERAFQEMADVVHVERIHRELDPLLASMGITFHEPA